jgi:hypothetical protein
MASKKTTKPAPADENLDDLFSGITDNSSKPKKSTTTSKTSKTASKPVAGADDDIFADIESQLTEKPASRPHTPRAGKRSTATPPVATDDKVPANARKSTDSAHSLRASFTPSATSSEVQENERRTAAAPVTADQPAQQEGGGWWGMFSSTANAALKQAEAAYKEIQQNEEAKKWADQVRGLSHLDVSTLKSYGIVTYAACSDPNIMLTFL